MKAEKAKKLTVSDLNLKKTAIRLLGQNLVSNEVLYIRRNLGATATQRADIANNLLHEFLPSSLPSFASVNLFRFVHKTDLTEGNEGNEGGKPDAAPQNSCVWFTLQITR